jgi:glutathione S-transferase
MICEYGGLEYEAKLYEIHKQEDGSYDKSEWFGTKPDLQAKNALMNLPYVVDGDVVVSQTIACLKYLGKKAGLNGATAAEECMVDQILCEAQDLRNGGVGFFYGSGADNEKRKEKLSGLAGSYGKFEAWLAQQGEGETCYTVGKTPTVGDFHLWEMLDQFEMMAADAGAASPLQDFPKLKKLYSSLRADPKLSKYFASDLYKLPPNNKFAGWGGGEPADWAKRFD